MHCGIEEELLANKGLDLKKLTPGVKINVETWNSIYFMTLSNNEGDVAIRGGTMQGGECRFAKSVSANLVGSHKPLHTALRMSWVGIGLCMDIQLDDGGFISTSPVKNVVIKAEDGSWFYSLDENS